MSSILFLIGGLLVGTIVGGAILFKIQKNQIIKSARERADALTREARLKSDEMRREADRKSKEAVEQARRKFEKSVENQTEEARRSVQKAKDIERDLKREQQELKEAKEKAEFTNERAQKAAKENERLSKVAAQTEEHFRTELEKLRQELEKVAAMTQKEAKDSLIKSIEEDAKLSSSKLVRAIEEQAREESDKLAKRIISIAISRYSSDYIPERTTTAVSLPSDEMKGKLIGREGRNIRALEAATGCDMIIDDTPETVIVSCFDPVRRHIGKMVLEQLIADGRVHPTRIEEIVEKAKVNIGKQIKEFGEKALLELNIIGMHPELVKLVGQLQFRYSYSQNQYYHVLETGHLCGLMAAELGLDVKKARRAGLLHDIGKGLTHEVDGSHAVIGADLAEKYGETPDVVYAIRAHHEDVKPEAWLDFLLIGADAISGARPGARREQLENYVRRIEDLERIANSHPGVERTYAIAAGREIRVMVENSRINDEQAIVLSREIAKKIEQDMTYPGQIKVTVIRETRAVSLAK
ncbi:MAG: ribonuclease Y [Bdellovibrionota bacterium]